jgi:pyridoxine 5-phosphate synthase
MTKLSVNVNKIATLRNARGGSVPDVLKVALDCERYGAEGITVHPRPDERHIRYADVHALSQHVHTEFNVEGFPDTKFMDLVLALKPAQVTLVPDPPHVLTSNAGWNTIKQQDFLRDILAELKKAGIRSSLFIDPDLEMIRHAQTTGTDRIELYTEAYAKNYPANPAAAIKPYTEAALLAASLNLGLNAGHDLSLENLQYFKKNIPSLLEVSIGHALICDALYYGLENTIRMYLRQLI